MQWRHPGLGLGDQIWGQQLASHPSGSILSGRAFPQTMLSTPTQPYPRRTKPKFISTSLAPSPTINLVVLHPNFEIVASPSTSQHLGFTPKSTFHRPRFPELFPASTFARLPSPRTRSGVAEANRARPSDSLQRHLQAWLASRPR